MFIAALDKQFAGAGKRQARAMEGTGSSTPLAIEKMVVFRGISR